MEKYEKRCGKVIFLVEIILLLAFPLEISVAAQTDSYVKQVFCQSAAIQPQLAAVAAGPMRTEGTELQVYVAVAVAEGSAGLDHINVQFLNTENDRSVTKILRPDDLADGVYADWISMSIYEPAGTYVLDKVILQDENGAYVRYCRAEDREEDDNYLTLPGISHAGGKRVGDHSDRRGGGRFFRGGQRDRPV